MLTIITTFHILAALAIIALVLLQQGKGADAGAAFGAGGSGTVFGARGAASFLTRTTAVLALVFFLTSLGLAWYASQQVERRSVVERTEASAESERVPGAPADVPNAASDVPAADVPQGTSSDN
jgi:preprotein translocase subunit SecG